RRNTRARHTA
ncbi:SAM-dependent methyltransferase, partial [Vibrio parahaemolyticus 970107]